MDFLPDADQNSLVEATREYIDSRFPLIDPPTRLDDARWKEITELGWLSLAITENSGGAGATLLDEVFVFREIGRGLVRGPILSTLAAARLAVWTGHGDLAEELVSGRSRVARAVALPGTDELLLLDADDAPLTLFLDADRVVLAQTAQQLNIRPGLEDGTSVCRTGHNVLETGEIVCDDAATVSRIRRTLRILTSAQLTGIAGATRDLATVFAKERIQFGKPIGAFQAIKHKCADMATAALAAENVTFFAALTEDSDYHALAAATNTRRAAFANARANVQIHGAMGFTVEDSAHRFVKRTHTLCTTEGFENSAARLGGLPSIDSSEES
ncbi:acyl-CoA dehydrogenase FadE18 [Mycolicibacter sinensis]|uniref:Acyl-CoA dehydrogenase FadE18 n=1 Tax=Mycolicibacter sinensis (strain JDM601) TaxID=875328 RepID=F5YRM0_MYCSD|nr:acyl-CoA dehydrogenase family protein [Mycolicibacter sinensis]AEF37811.1 acyl-CoA dehydrogenase FadE18 [Mycolicibacter sinensis]